MYPYKIALISQEVFNLSLFIQKLNFTFGRKAYFCYYNAGLENYKGACLPQCKDNMTLFYPRQTKLLNKFTRRLIHFLFLFYFFTFHAHVKLKTKFTVYVKKKGLSRHHAMHYFHTITPITLLFHESRPEKGPITPSRQPR